MNRAYTALALLAMNWPGPTTLADAPGVPRGRRMMLPKYNARRNDRCPCGSGRKFKRCCIRETTAVEVEPDDVKEDATP